MMNELWSQKKIVLNCQDMIVMEGLYNVPYFLPFKLPRSEFKGVKTNEDPDSEKKLNADPDQKHLNLRQLIILSWQR